MFLLDTNVVSELQRSRPHPAVVGWLQGVDESHLHLSALTLGEIQAGVEITRSQDPPRASAIEAWLDQVAGAYNIIPMGAREFRAWARLMHGRSDDLIEDAMIAATAEVHNLIVVTRNLKDFRRLGARTLNPFHARAR